MLPFDPEDPFPLLTEGQVPYANERTHSTEVDRWLGFNIQHIEKLLQAHVPQEDWPRQWIGLAPESLQTPYTEIRFLLSQLDLKPGLAIADLGCAYGRIAHVLHRHSPLNPFFGIEAVASRIEEAKRVSDLQNLSGCTWIWTDFTGPEFQIPPADIIFIYDSSTTQALKALLQRLKTLGREKKIQVVGRGRRIRDLIERGEPWLSQVHPPRHFKNFSIYQTP
jgi:hypothetical protein